MRRITFQNRFTYWFDNMMARGTVAMIAWLFILSVVLILAIAFFVRLTGSDERSFLELTWAALMRTLDPGTMGGDQGSPLFLFSMLAVTLGGIFLVSLLIGVLTSGIESKLDQLRKGKSQVIEDGHTAILGWSPQIFSILSELVIANANQKRRQCIAILAPEDKVEMETEIRERIGKPGRTRIVCRSGSPIDLNDLEIVSPNTARSIIILPPAGEDADILTIKAILALTNNPNRKDGKFHIVAEMREEKNLDVARLVGGDEVELLQVDDLISRITAQTCRQSGLSVIYTDLLDFGGDEIYFKEESGLVGKTYADALLAYEDSAVIGLRWADGRLLLNPPMDSPISPGDQVIAISEDDDTINLSGLTELQIANESIRTAAPDPAPSEKTLILGWNRRATRIISELEHYVAAGSALTVVADRPVEEMGAACEPIGQTRQEISFLRGDPTSRRLIDSLEIDTYDHVITLSNLGAPDPQKADAHTLVTLLHLRDISDKHGNPFSIVSEMRDVRNRAIAEVTRADDFIVSDQLVSLMLTQIAENKELAAVFEDLFDPAGAEIYLKPAGDYVQLDQPVNFYTIVESARRRGGTAIGYRIQSQAEDPRQGFGVRINPPKSDMIVFREGDWIISLAES